MWHHWISESHIRSARSESLREDLRGNGGRGARLWDGDGGTLVAQAREHPDRYFLMVSPGGTSGTNIFSFLGPLGSCLICCLKVQICLGVQTPVEADAKVEVIQIKVEV